MDEANIDQTIEPTIEHVEQLSTDESDRAFFDKYLDTHVFVPESIDDRQCAYDALRVLRRSQFAQNENFDAKDILDDIERISADVAQPPLAHLAAIDALARLTSRASDMVNPTRTERILSNFEYIVNALPNNDTRTFKSVNDAYLHQMALLAAIYNSLNMETPIDEEFPENSRRLKILAEVMRAKRLRMNMPHIIISSRRGETTEEILVDGLPESRVILSPLHVADERKMEAACQYWGYQLNRDYQLRLPGALVAMETDKKDIYDTERRVIGNIRNLYFVRIPILEAIDENNNSILSGLLYYTAVKVSREVRNQLNLYAENPQPKTLHKRRKTYLEKGISAVVEAEIDEMIEYISQPVTPRRRNSPTTTNERTYRGILETAIAEYKESQKVDLDIETVKASLKKSLRSLLLIENPRSDQLGYRSEDELSEIAVAQTLAKLNLDDLVFLTNEFISHRGVRASTLTEEQRIYLDDVNIRNQLNELMVDIKRTRYISDEKVKEYEETLRAFLENVMAVRYETIRNNQIPASSVMWKK